MEKEAEKAEKIRGFLELLQRKVLYILCVLRKLSGVGNGLHKNVGVVGVWHKLGGLYQNQSTTKLGHWLRNDRLQCSGELE